MAPILAALIALLLAPTLALAQATAPPVTVLADPPPADWIPPDPTSWWTDDWPKAPEAAEPLGPRRLGRGERLTEIDNGVGPDLYRLWGLQPLQTRIIRGDEMILEVWVRPARSVRQTVIRLYARRDGESFVQARAGLACCEAGIARRVGFDAKLAPGWTSRLKGLRALPAWDSPRDVLVDEGGGVTDAVCVDGVAYDLTLLTPGRARHLRRACDSPAIGEVADVLEAALGATLGHEPRIDVVFPRGADFSSARAAYQAVIADGGRLKATPQARVQPPAFEAPPEPEVTAPAAPAPPTARNPAPTPSTDDGRSPGP